MPKIKLFAPVVTQVKEKGSEVERKVRVGETVEVSKETTIKLDRLKVSYTKVGKEDPVKPEPGGNKK